MFGISHICITESKIEILHNHNIRCPIISSGEKSPLPLVSLNVPSSSMRRGRKVVLDDWPKALEDQLDDITPTPHIPAMRKTLSPQYKIFTRDEVIN